MVREKKRGVGSVTVWMIVFVALWLASTVVLVILYTGQEELRDENARLQEDNQRLISSSERNSVELFRRASKEGPTVVALLEGARSETARLATGDEAEDPAAIRAKLDEFLSTVRSDAIVPEFDRFEDVSFHEASTMLYKAFDARNAAQRQAEERVEQLEAEISRLSGAVVQASTDFDIRSNELRQQLEEVEQGRTRYRTERDEEVAKLEREFEERRALGDADLTEERQRVAALELRVERLKDRILVYQDRLGEVLIGPEELATARRPDGKILTAYPGDEVVYINLGRKQKVLRGLTFAVYSTRGGIPSDGRAKAQIEVVSMDEQSAECRIVEMARNAVIMEGDLIANPIYDSDRAVRFVVLGEFDLDHDGLPDPAGAPTIRSMVTEWGGTLSEELTALTDFVVLGAAPRRPRPVRDAAPEEAERARAMQQLFDGYHETVRAARTLSIPVLTQEVFLNFLGYTGRHGRR